jgi:hypothetical protein
MAEPFNTQRSPEDSEGERPCLANDEVLDFAAGRLSAGALELIHTHLDRCGACQRLVGEAVRERSSDVAFASDPARWNTTFRSGDVVGNRYRVLKFVARGGMGEVYEAYDRDLQERVALKTVLSTACDGQRAVRRLKAEVQLAHRVSHPNVCRIYDLGSHRLERHDGVLNFLTMEFVEGERLAERITRGPIPASEAEPVVRSLLLGLEAAHAAGILHRDLKSDNVMLRPVSSGCAMPVIMDFGLARAIDLDVARLTSSAYGLAGTPCYMAPEQLENGELTTATDVYAFGVMWFEMLTGRLPFSLRAPFERLTKPPPRPSTFVNDIPAGIDKIVVRCLERDPQHRFGSAREVLDALDTLEQGDASLRASGIRARSVPRSVAPLAACAALIVLFVVLRLNTTRPLNGVAPVAAISVRSAATARRLSGSATAGELAKLFAIVPAGVAPAASAGAIASAAAYAAAPSPAKKSKTGGNGAVRPLQRAEGTAAPGIASDDGAGAKALAQSIVVPREVPMVEPGAIRRLPSLDAASSPSLQSATKPRPSTEASPPTAPRPTPEQLGWTDPFGGGK